MGRAQVTITPLFSAEFGRLPQDVSAWISRLLDMGDSLFAV